MKVIVDKLNASVLMVPTFKQQNTVKRPRVRWYNRKSPKAAKRIKTMINFMYYENKEQIDKGEVSLFFTTITTCQHKNGFSDRELFARVGKFNKNLHAPYVCVCERQRDTQDLHFHIVTLFAGRKLVEFRKGIQWLGDQFSVPGHPALLDCKRVTDLRRVVGYIRKYVTKDNGKYSSLFTCRTYSISNNLARAYRQVADRYIKKFDSSKSDFDLFWKSIVQHLEIQHETDFFCSFKFTDYIWQQAQKYQPDRVVELKE